ncbi:hypothetical protein ACRDNQ_01560 [Palleronia sp. KMU-117]|uniref:hypothetical protein n=1 Tax=Palleronia sp. KMU-117 TaxID=3434108 RepID=UPI003D756851
MTRRTILRAAALAGLLALPLPDRAPACTFHTALPEASLSENIAASVEVIAARPSAENPFAFETVAVLRGEASGTAPPFMVDSVTRARLARKPDEAVLFARAPDGAWTRLLILDAVTHPVVDTLVSHADVWATPAGAAERRDFFARLLAHRDAQIRRIALRELDALPYEVLRGGTYPVTAADLVRGLTDINEQPFAPIRILLLGLDDSDGAGQAIARRLAMMATLRMETNLGPWITAAIERDGPAGLAAIEQEYLAAPARLSDRQLDEIVRALAVHRTGGDPALQAPIDTALRTLAFARPDAAPAIARTFATASDFSQVPLIREIAAARLFASPQDLLVAAAYVAGAPRNDGPGSDRDTRTEQSN